MTDKVSPSFLFSRFFSAVAVRLVALRQAGLNRVLSGLYGSPVAVGPTGQVGVAGAVIFWYLQDGFKQFLMIKNTDGADQRARFVSAYGLHGQPHMGDAVRLAVMASLGKVFTKTVDAKLLGVDRVAAVPVFTTQDEITGQTSPVQALVWCVQIQPTQAELVATPKGMAVAVVPEFGMSSSKVSPTHRGLWQAVGRHLPKAKLPAAEIPAEAVDDAVRGVDTGPRTLH